MKKLSFILFFLFACSSKKQPAVIYLALKDNKRSVEVKGFDRLILQEIARGSSNEVWQTLIPVYRMPADTDLKTYQPVQPGRYLIQNSAVVFTPDTPFIKGQTYFMRYYRLQGATLADFIKGAATPGKMHFTDLIFKR